MSRQITYAEAIREAQDFCLREYPSVYLMGLGVPDPKGIFGTTLGLQQVHGADRVFDIPLSENAMTGVALGSAVTGMRPILTHQRLDFALVSIEQIVNQAAKWHYMFGGTMKAPLVIRMIVGRGWGQGPQHSQSLHAWFAHVPGLKVIMPTTAYDAKGMLIAAVEDDNPVVCIEHRWLYGIKDAVPEAAYRVPLDRARVMVEGHDVTLVGVSYMTLECLKAAELVRPLGISAEVIDLRAMRPIDGSVILASVRKTGRLLVVDHADPCCGVAAEVVALVAENALADLAQAPRRLCLPEHPTPSSPALADSYYPAAREVAAGVLAMLGRSEATRSLPRPTGHLDQPDANFRGPF